ncbi:hypothetical protein ACFWIA_18365 [Streptomyces sp. NPDC127068]|uniref:hypothetical protein n=1 Tax=Streptomyces sp. NPDC127068 TaxID=3347127 RepID=UPI003652188B
MNGMVTSAIPSAGTSVRAASSDLLDPAALSVSLPLRGSPALLFYRPDEGYGIRILVADGERVNMLLEPRPHAPLRHTPAAWCFVEKEPWPPPQRSGAAATAVAFPDA